MSCRDGAPHSIGCPCWNEKVREDAYAEIARLLEDWLCLDNGAEEAVAISVRIRALAEKRRLEAGETALRDL